MKRYLSAFVAVVLCITISSCSSNQDASSDDSYLEGIEKGYEDVFLNLWWAATPGVNILASGEAWETEHFSLVITPVEGEKENHLQFKLETYDLTMDECFVDQKMLFNVFSYNGSQYDGLLTDDLFYMYATLEVFEEHTASATVRLYEDTEKVAILVVVDGCVYKASYHNR